MELWAEPRRPPWGALLAAALAQLRAEVERVPSERRRSAAHYPPPGSVLWRTAAQGWVWLPRGAVPDAARVDPARCWAEKLASMARVAFAHELAVVLAKTFPREIIIRIYLEAAWGEKLAGT